MTPASGQSRRAPRLPAVESTEASSRERPIVRFAALRTPAGRPVAPRRPPVRPSGRSPPPRAPRDGRVQQPAGARRARGRRRRGRRGRVRRRLGHGQLHPRPARLARGAEARRDGAGPGGAALPRRRPEPAAAPAAALGPPRGDPAGEAGRGPRRLPEALGRGSDARPAPGDGCPCPCHARGFLPLLPRSSRRCPPSPRFSPIPALSSLGSSHILRAQGELPSRAE